MPTRLFQVLALPFFMTMLQSRLYRGILVIAITETGIYLT